MRTLDFSPLFRSTVGFDRIQNMLDAASRIDEANSAYPPYNIEVRGEDAYRITMAVAGFGNEDLEITENQGTLTVSGNTAKEEADTVYLHRGIAGRSFTRRFQLADYVRVSNAALVNGLLHIDLVRELPEAMKPRTIAIGTESAGAKTLNAKAA